MSGKRTMMNDEALKTYFDEHYPSQDVKQFLKDLGVSNQHIQSIEGQKIKAYPLPRNVFDDLGECKDMIIPTSQIIGSGLFGNIGHEWIDLARYALCDDFHSQSINLIPKRLRACFSWLYQLGWDEWNKTYQTDTIGKLYFSSLETENRKSVQYMHEGGIGGGRHRFFAAKLGGATHIRAAHVQQYRLNSEKVAYYQSYQQLEQQIRDVVDQSQILHKKSEKDEDNKDCYKVMLVHSDSYYNHDLGYLFVADDDIKELKDFKQYTHMLEAILDTLTMIENLSYQVQHSLYRWLPQWYIKKNCIVAPPNKWQAHSDDFLMKTKSFKDFIKWHQLYDYKRQQAV